MDEREVELSARPERKRSVVICYEHSDRVSRAVRGARALLRAHAAIEMSDAPTADVILATAHEHHVALIVVGSSGRSVPPSPPLGGVSSTLVQSTDIPLLVVPSPRTAAAADHHGPILICFDGSDEARSAVGAAADLLASEDAILASFLEPVDDNALLRSTLPWSPSVATQRRIAGLDEQEAEFLAKLGAEGVALAGRQGLRSRPLAIERPGPVSDPRDRGARQRSNSAVRQDRDAHRDMRSPEFRGALVN